jgi:hypothetical protein
LGLDGLFGMPVSPAVDCSGRDNLNFWKAA